MISASEWIIEAGLWRCKWELWWATTTRVLSLEAKRLSKNLDFTLDNNEVEDGDALRSWAMQLEYARPEWLDESLFTWPIDFIREEKKVQELAWVVGTRSSKYFHANYLKKCHNISSTVCCKPQQLSSLSSRSANWRKVAKSVIGDMLGLFCRAGWRCYVSLVVKCMQVLQLIGRNRSANVTFVAAKDRSILRMT